MGDPDRELVRHDDDIPAVDRLPRLGHRLVHARDDVVVGLAPAGQRRAAQVPPVPGVEERAHHAPALEDVGRLDDALVDDGLEAEELGERLGGLAACAAAARRRAPRRAGRGRARTRRPGGPSAARRCSARSPEDGRRARGGGCGPLRGARDEGDRRAPDQSTWARFCGAAERGLAERRVASGRRVRTPRREAAADEPHDENENRARRWAPRTPGAACTSSTIDTITAIPRRIHGSTVASTMPTVTTTSSQSRTPQKLTASAR